MALVTRSTNASMDAASGGLAPHISDGLIAGEALDVAAPCYIKASDGKVYMCNGTATGEAVDNYAGFTARATSAGQPVSLFAAGAKFHYADATLTPGQKLYIGATAGRLNTATTTGDAVGVAQAVTASIIRVTRNVL